MENWKKVPIVVPKVAFWGTFGTTIGTFCCVFAVFLLCVDVLWLYQYNQDKSR